MSLRLILYQSLYELSDHTLALRTHEPWLVRKAVSVYTKRREKKVLMKNVLVKSLCHPTKHKTVDNAMVDFSITEVSSRQLGCSED